jgi:hypothetical protein
VKNVGTLPHPAGSWQTFHPFRRVALLLVIK